ncbi:MAG: hypothetical protein XXXJIFNMEKO3_00139 [Candidatus Erwinia impunctatus]|nr:hypothetical protein XXXJIFNMEKO_00139 [Culicoides impunctatus]
MLIRAEIGMDVTGIDALLRRVFPTDQQARAVWQSREQGLLTLGMVACDDEGKILGYMAFSPVMLNGEDLQWVGLAPIAIDAQCVDEAATRELLYEGLSTLNEFGYAAVVVIGDPAYYRPLGFEVAAQHQLVYQQHIEETLQVYAFSETAFDGQSGLIAFAPPLNDLLS